MIIPAVGSNKAIRFVHDNVLYVQIWQDNALILLRRNEVQEQIEMLEKGIADAPDLVTCLSQEDDNIFVHPAQAPALLQALKDAQARFAAASAAAQKGIA